MSEIHSLELALFNFLPNIAFLFGAFYLIRISLILCGRLCAFTALSGAVLIGIGGLLKASWKLLLTLEIADIDWMSDSQFILITPGYLLLLLVVIQILRFERKTVAVSPALFLAAWKVPFLAVLTLTSLGTQGILFVLALRSKTQLAAAAFLISFLGLLAMGGLSGSEQTLGRQWIEEGINTSGQIGFAVGTWLLYRKVQEHRVYFPAF